MDLRNGNCLELMKTLPDKSVDLFICDLPYVDITGKGETNCKWNQGNIDMEEFWKQYKRIRKHDRVACIHFCSTKFGYTLIKSWEKGFKMDMVWKKRNKTGGLSSRYRPMRNHEMVYFFYDKCPKYNRDKYHKRILPKKIHDVKQEDGVYGTKSSDFSVGIQHTFKPPNPSSVINEITYDNKKYKQGEKGRQKGQGVYGINVPHTPNKYDVPNPTSVINEVEDSVYGEGVGEYINDFRKKEGGKFKYEPLLPVSVINEVEDKDYTYGDKKYLKEKENTQGTNNFEPPNPASVILEVTPKDQVYGKACKGKGANSKEYRDMMKAKGLELYYEPPNPASVIDERINDNNKSSVGWDIKYMDKPRVPSFEPKLPLSVLSQVENAVIKKLTIPAEDEPKTMYESTKVFIGKRHHQTEKPQDILEFFIKYWTDEGQTILDPTMGSGSTGVACKTLKRNFIGFELDPKIYKTALKRING